MSVINAHDHFYHAKNLKATINRNAILFKKIEK